MNLTVKGRNLVLTEAISTYAEEKIGRLGRYLTDGSRCEVEIWTEKNPSISDNQVVEATIFTKGPVIRAREASPDIRASIDLVFDKLERQVKKYRGKLHSHQGPAREAFAAEGFAIPAENVKFFLDHRDAFAYSNENPGNPYRYLEPPSRIRQTRVQE